MKNFRILLPVAAMFVAISPFAADAASRGVTSHSFVYAAGVETQHVAANSKGRPGEFQPLVQQADAGYSFATGPSPNKDGAPIQNGN